MPFRIRKAVLHDLADVMPVYDEARAYMRTNGNMHQWTGGYPSEEQIRKDIQTGHLYICFDDEGLAGVFVFFTDVEPTYVRIYEGAWLNEDPYGVIHRVAVTSHRHGVASFCFAWCLEQCRNLKIDTHRDNIPMRHSLLKNGFTYCGLIYLESGDERLAFQKSL